jgi:hypothetical protein
MKRQLPAIAAVLLASAMHAGSGGQIIGGPYVVNVKSTSATVVWVIQNGADLRAETLPLTDLKPGTVQKYKIPNAPELEGTFKTAPVEPVPFEFVVFGDTRTRHDVHRRVIQAILNNSSPDFVLHSGDLVSNGTDQAQWPTFFDIEGPMLRKMAFFPALGNHERNSPKFYEFFQVGTPYYSFDWGNAHFIVLNSDLGNAGANGAARDEFWTRQTRWFEDDLKKSQSAAFRFVMAHHPPFSAVSRRQESNPEMRALVPLFEKYHVTAGFFGHDHNYQHYLKDNVHYVISGGGGAPLYDVDAAPQGITQKVSRVEHFVKIDVSGKTAKVVTIAVDGSTLDQFDLDAFSSR